MTRPTMQDGDTVREMNDSEFDQYKLDAVTGQKQIDDYDKTQAAQAAAKASVLKKLAALGLTPDEIAAL